MSAMSRSRRWLSTGRSRPIREDIDRGTARVAATRRQAARHILDAEPMSVPDPAELRAELDDLRGWHE